MSGTHRRTKAEPVKPSDPGSGVVASECSMSKVTHERLGSPARVAPPVVSSGAGIRSPVGNADGWSAVTNDQNASIGRPHRPPQVRGRRAADVVEDRRYRCAGGLPGHDGHPDHLHRSKPSVRGGRRCWGAGLAISARWIVATNNGSGGPAAAAAVLFVVGTIASSTAVGGASWRWRSPWSAS